MNALRPLILDLDFTLLHLQFVTGAIEVPGRTRSAWIAPATVDALRVLQRDFEIVLATARSWDGTRWVTEGLSQRGVAVQSVVLEDGALLGNVGNLQPMETRDWNALRFQIETQRDDLWPAFAWQNDFRACLVARAETTGHAALLHEHFSRFTHDFHALRTLRDGRKVYLTSAKADKWRALQELLGDVAARCVGVGDGANDACWLQNVAQPCTLTGAASEIVELVRARGGYVSPLSGHDGIADVLRHVAGIAN